MPTPVSALIHATFLIYLFFNSSYIVFDNFDFPSTTSGRELVLRTNTKGLNTSIKQLQSDPWFVTGFAYAESSFLLNIYKSPKARFNYGIKLTFQITVHKKDTVEPVAIATRAPRFFRWDRSYRIFK